MRRSIRLKRLIIILLIILIIVGIFQLIKIRSDNNRFKELTRRAKTSAELSLINWIVSVGSLILFVYAYHTDTHSLARSIISLRYCSLALFVLHVTANKLEGNLNNKRIKLFFPLTGQSRWDGTSRGSLWRTGCCRFSVLWSKQINCNWIN